MADGMMLIGAAAAAVLGFAWLALAMQGHWEQVHEGAVPSQTARAALRVFGVGGLLISGILCFTADHPSMAVLLWIMLMAVGALIIALTLAWKPTLLQVFWMKTRKSRIGPQQ